MSVILIGGGARSGKSRFAVEYAENRFRRLAFVATAKAGDEEMTVRIRQHQVERGDRWTTVEEPLDIVQRMGREAPRFDVFVVDCLTLWLSNVLLRPGREPGEEVKRLIDHLGRADSPNTILVTNEVGCGIVPENELARRYRDLVGEANQAVGKLADEIYWMVFGVPVPVKGAGSNVRDPLACANE